MSRFSTRQSTGGIEYALVEPKKKPTGSTAIETLICMHGIGGDHLSFAPQLDALSETRRVIAWNMPGYRGSVSMPDMTFANLALALDKFRTELGIDKVHLVGQSIGGMIAQEYAAGYPERVNSLVLIATTAAFGGRDDSFEKRFLDARLAPLEAGRSMSELAPEFVPDIVGAGAAAEVIEAATQSMAAVPESTYRDVVKCLVTFDRRAALEKYTVPVCLLAGAEDQNAPPRTVEKMSEKIADAEYHLISGAGHLVNLEAPAASNAIIEAFLASIATR